MSHSRIAKAVRLALVTGGALGVGFHGAVTIAQEQEEVTTVVVTGSRIATPELTSVSPLQIVGEADIEAAGVANIQDLLIANPSFGTPTFSRTNSNFLVSSSGVATIDLRNLGEERTLVLVDGRRFVAGIPGTSAVDLNAIPAQFLERVEILTGGASAVYGSDAVAGVVNFIYRKDFEGFEFDSQFGESAESDSDDRQVSLTVGVNSADGRGNIMAHVGYTDQGAVFTRDRDFAAIDQISRMALTGDPADAFIPQRPFFSSFAPQGRIFAGPTQYTFDANNQLITGFSTNGSATRAPDGFNRSAHRSIAVPTERYLFATRGTFEFVENHSAFLEGTYSGTQATSELEPFPLSAEDIYPAAGGQVPIEFESFAPDPANPGQFIRTVQVNPLVPAPILASATDTDGDGLRDIFFTRRMSEFGNRGNTADRDIYRAVGGFEGTLFGNWRYDAFYGYGSTKESQVSGGQVNVLNFRHALEVVPGPLGPMCRDAEARAQGCVPANIFAGRGGISAASVDYIEAPGLLGTFTTQKLAGLNFSGELLDLPAGPLGIAVGGEYREEFSRSEFDPLQQAGLNAGNAIPRQEGEFHVIEGYLETNVPLLAEAPFADMLSARAAVRLSDYSTVGNTTSWNAGLEWSPIEQIRFRAIRAISTRAPNIEELFAPPSQTFPPGLVDPCLGVTASSSGPSAAACRADPGVAANIAANGSFTLNQPDIQGISGFNLGNPFLQEEEGKSWTFGVVFNDIPWAPNLGLTVDYFDIEIDDAIVATPRQFILDQCYTTGQFCQFITRRPAPIGANSAGSIEFIDSADSNSGGYATSGFDVTLQYVQNLDDWRWLRGRLGAKLAYTRVEDGYLIPLPGAERDHFAGEVDEVSKNRANLHLVYDLGKFRVNWRAVYLGRASLDDQFLLSSGLAPGSIGIGSYTYHHAQLGWNPGNFELFVGANNVFDKAPPPIISGLPGNDTGTETEAGTYDAIGRTYYGGVRMKF